MIATTLPTMKRKESPLFSRTYDLVCWLIPLTIKFPRQYRFVVAEALQRSVLQFQELLIGRTTQTPLDELVQFIEIDIGPELTGQIADR